jgi:hypothetical protein
MLLTPMKVHDVAREMLQLLQAEGHIESSMPREVQLDLEAVLNQYIRTEQELIARARQTLDSRGLSNRDFGRVLQTLADQKGVKVGEEAMDYVLEQLLEMLLNSSNVDEIYAEDHDLRRQLRIPLRKLEDLEMQKSEKKPARVVSLAPEEATPSWELEYNKLLEDIRRRRGG